MLLMYIRGIQEEDFEEKLEMEDLSKISALGNKIKNGGFERKISTL